MAFRTPRDQPSTPYVALRAPTQDIELQRTMLASSVTFPLSSLCCLSLTKQNP
jgi:hypothetical protein